MSQNPQISQNLRLVEYFVSEFYRNKTADLAHIASTSFVFKLNEGPEHNFEIYAQSMMFLVAHAQMEYGEITSDDDITFVKPWVHCMKTDRGMTECGEGHTKFTVRDGLLQSVQVLFDVNEYVFKYYDKLRQRHFDDSIFSE